MKELRASCTNSARALHVLYMNKSDCVGSTEASMDDLKYPIKLPHLVTGLINCGLAETRSSAGLACLGKKVLTRTSSALFDVLSNFRLGPLKSLSSVAITSSFMGVFQRKPFKPPCPTKTRSMFKNEPVGKTERLYGRNALDA